MVPALRQHVHQLHRRGSRIPVMQLTLDNGQQIPLECRAVQRCHRLRCPLLQLRCQIAHPLRRTQVLANPARRIQRLDTRQQHRLVEKLVAHELRQVVGNALLVARNDGRVRNRNAHGMAEQRRDGKPVRQRSHGCRFGKRRHPGPDAGPAKMHAQCQQRHRQQQRTQCNTLHVAQAARLLGSTQLHIQHLGRRIAWLHAAIVHPVIPLCGTGIQPSPRFD